MNPPPYTRGKLFLLIVFFSPYCALLDAGTDPCSELAHAKSFSFGATTMTGRVVSGERAFSQVLHQPAPVHCFQKLMKTGNREGTMYALVGLRELDRGQFYIELERLRRQRFTVVTLATAQQGVIETESGGTVLQQVADGLFHRDFEFCRKHLALVE